MCGETVTATAGTIKAWVTWAAGVATVVVPADAPTAKTTVTITAAYPSQGGGSNAAVSTATGSFVLTLDVTGAPKAAGAGGSGAKGGAADVTATAAAVVAGVLGGALFAAAFAPAPPAATAGAGATGAAGGASGNADA